MNKIWTGFLSGAVCAGVAFAVAPWLVWLGAPAGFIAGYVAYDFRHVLRSIPAVARAAGWGSIAFGIGLRHSIHDFFSAILRWLSKPHPFLYPSAVVTAGLASQSVMVWEFFSVFFSLPEGWIGGMLIGFLGLEIFALVFMCSTYIGAIPIAILAFIGSRVSERTFWWPFLMVQKPGVADRKDWSRYRALRKAGYQRAEVTYANVFRWSMKGLGIVLFFFVWTWWTQVIIFLAHFFRELFVRIHSNERVFYPLTATVGGFVGYFATQSLATTTSAQALAVICSGIVGAALIRGIDLAFARRRVRIAK